MLQELSNEGVIEAIESSEWVSPIVLVRKPDQKLRVCIDLRALNSNIVIDCHPLPNINEVVSLFEGAQIFSTLDLRSAYHQIELMEESRKYTAFITPFGLYQYTRMPFGLASAASVFQRVMYQIFRDVDHYVKCFQDDILIFSRNEEEHARHLSEVCRRLQSQGLTLKAHKCKLFKKSVEYLGHTLSGDGVVPKKNNVEPIVKAPPPANKEQLLSFMGMCEYYSKFVEGFATKMEPLRMLLRQNVKYEWSDERQQAFEDIKYDIVNAPTLKPFRMRKECIITVDASLYGLGGVLSQKEGKVEWNVAFASRTLSECERRYAVIERELLACGWAVEHYRLNIWGSKFTIRTDHKPLVSILSTGGGWNSTARIARLASKLQEYSFKVEYLPGKKMLLQIFGPVYLMTKIK